MRQTDRQQSPRRPAIKTRPRHPVSVLPDPAQPSSSATVESASQGGILDALVLAAVNGLLVCRWLVPTEAPGLGESLWIAQASILAFVLWCYAGYRAGALRMRFGWIDAAVCLLAGGQVLSALVVLATEGDKRSALNLLWEWMGLGITFFLLRQVFDTALVRRGVIFTMLSVAVALTGLGIFQFHSSYSQLMTDYMELKTRLARLQAESPRNEAEARKRDFEIRKVQGEYVRQGIPFDETARMLWEQRLKSSREPVGMFALTNTLAGFLLCASLLWLAELRATLWRPVNWRLLILTGLASGGVAFCLIITKSRTAFVGLLTGGMVWIWLARGSPSADPRRLMRTIVAGSLIAAGLGGIAWSTRGLDRLVLAESGKSLRYRLEYWTATWNVICESPRSFWLGTGPGNFRQHYLKYKLPESSEEVADPHNMFLDVWGNAGIPALLGLIGICLGGLWNTVRSPVQHPEEILRMTSGDGDEKRAVWPLLAGGGAAFLVTWLASGANDSRFAGLFAAWLATVVLFRNRLQQVNLYLVAVGAAFMALCIHLLGAGGIAMPAITQTLLLLLAAGAQMNGTGPNGSRSPRTGQFVFTKQWGQALSLAGSCGLFALCWFSATAPVMARYAHVAGGDYFTYNKQDFASADAEFQRAAEADPLCSEPWTRRAVLWFTRWQASQRDSDFDQGVEFQKQAILRNPLGFVEHRLLGEWYFIRSEKSHSPEIAARAAESFAEVVARYPNSARFVARLAVTESSAGHDAAAQSAARRSLELNDINRRLGHEDKILPERERLRLESILGKRSGKA